LRRTAACAAVAALLGGACEQRETWAQRRQRAFERAAAAVNGPIEELRPLQDIIADPGGEGVVLLDVRRDACLKAAPIVARIEHAPPFLDEKGAPLEPAEGVRRAAGQFGEWIAACRGGQPEAAAPQAGPACVTRCARSWASLGRAVERLHVDADWFGVNVPRLAPPPPPDAGPTGPAPRP
jgi:hypothetical protein